MTDTDRELLEWAAKAVGFQIIRHHDGIIRHYDCAAVINDNGHWQYWNPRDNSCDSFYLLVRLGMRLQFFSLDTVEGVPGKHLITVSWAPGGEKNRTEDVLELSADPQGAARYAVLRAAAEIGRRMA